MSYWHKPGYWRWLWRERVGRDVKIFLACVAAVGLGAVGFLVAFQVADYHSTASTRLLTIVHTLPGQTNVVTEIGTVTEQASTDTQLVTVTRAGREVVIEVPGKTITDVHTATVRGPMREHVVVSTRTHTNTETQTNTRTQTQTQTQTETVDRPVTVTITQTETETRNVPGPTQTVTETETETVTHTETETETETQTVTVTEPPQGP